MSLKSYRINNFRSKSISYSSKRKNNYLRELFKKKKNNYKLLKNNTKKIKVEIQKNSKRITFLKKIKNINNKENFEKYQLYKTNKIKFNLKNSFLNISDNVDKYKNFKFQYCLENFLLIKFDMKIKINFSLLRINILY